MLLIKKNYLTKNRCYISGKKRTPIGIQIHTIGCAQGTAQAVADYWNQNGVDCCVTYICDCDEAGKVLQLLPEDYYTWADAGFGNRNLITIEVCESDFMKYTGGANYTVTHKEKFEEDVLRGYDTAVLLCADICKRYNWDPLSKLHNGLYLISSHDEGREAGLSSAHVDPSHLWPKLGLSMKTFRQAVANVLKKGSMAPSSDTEAKYYRVRKSWTDIESQIGAYEVLGNAKDACPPGYSVFDYTGKNVYTNKCSTVGTQASAFEELSESEAAELILDIVHITDDSGILNSVTAAQMILESGYVTTSLAKSANNCFGMKTNLSNNTWNSVWDGKSSVMSLTWEVYDGVSTQIYADFRKYPCIEDSIKDHAAYILGAKSGNKLRYDGILKAKNYKEAITIIKNGGYATDPIYISKICSIIERFGLNKYDAAPVEEKKEETKKEVKYAVQAGAYKTKGNATKKKKSLTRIFEEKNQKITVSIIEKDGMYLVLCGTFKTKANATKRVNRLKKLSVESFIKEI